MSASDSGLPRQVVPRWRSWRTTARLGETASVATGGRAPQPFVADESLARFRTRPNVGRAGELLATAFNSSYRDNEIDAVAGAHLDSDRVLLRQLAQATLSDPVARLEDAAHVEYEDPRVRVARLKTVLAREPRNALRWADLAREYTVLAQADKAERAIKVSLQLAPNSRFVLRSAAALYVQIGDKERALEILDASPTVTSDPWVLAPYVAISDLAARKARRHRDAARLLDDQNIDARHLAELAAALGTSELNAGDGRRGRQLLRRSVESPTDNSLAQVEWMSALYRSRLVERTDFGVPRDFEAQGRRAAFEGRWSDAVWNSTQWLTDQPFAAEAACFGSFCAWVAEDWAVAHRLAADGLRSNPGNPVLLNNAAVALVEAGDLRTAVTLLCDGRTVAAQRRDRAVLAATEGLLFFRVGMVEHGRQRYEQIISIFEDKREDDLAGRAALMLAREEILAGTAEAETSWKRAEAMTSASVKSDIVTLRHRLSSALPASPDVVARSRDVEPLVGPLLELPATL